MPSDAGTVLITGVSRGIGEIIANFFLDRDWRVVGLSRSESSISHRNFHWHQADLSQESEVTRVVEALEGTFDCVVLNAGMLGPMGRVLEIPVQGWRDTFDLNFFGPLALIRSVFGRSSENACFIFLSGGGAVTQLSGVGPYAISKLALVKLAEQLSLEYPGYRFYAMAPGAVDTEIFREHHERSGGPAPRFTDSKEIHTLIAHFLDDSDGRLHGRLIHVRDDIEKLLKAQDGA